MWATANLFMELKKEKIKFVDGFKIRNTLDPDFCLLHGYSVDISKEKSKYYIPQGEVWIDSRFKDEFDFLWAVYQFMTPDEKHTYREKRELVKQKLCLPGIPPEFVLKREKRKEFEIVYVDGKIVRQYIDPEFMFGAHSYVYSYIPENEIWLDIKTEDKEIPFILLHEEVERRLMKEEGKNYDIAHDYATTAEKEARRKIGNYYPGDDNYPWWALSNEEIIEREYIVDK
mgnify:CR=1 FL=1